MKTLIGSLFISEAESDFEMVEIEGYDSLLPIAVSSTENVRLRSLLTGSELMPYSEDAAAVVPSENQLDFPSQTVDAGTLF